MLGFLQKLLTNRLSYPTLSSREKQRFKKIYKKLDEHYPSGEDAWGLNLEHAKKTLEMVYPIYRRYFRVRTFGAEYIENRPYMVIANHSGQIAIDGMLICTSFITEIDPPRILRPMVERFFTGLPFLGQMAAEGGSVLGDRQNCIQLMERGESVLVFPEGVKGVAKSRPDYYKLQPFTRGFYRLSIATGVPILPVAVVGAEEFYPYVYQLQSVAKALGLPALPISPNYFPLPSPVDIHIGEPIYPPEGLYQDSLDKDIAEEVYRVEKQIKDMISYGLEKRRSFWSNIENTYKKKEGKSHE